MGNSKSKVTVTCSFMSHRIKDLECDWGVTFQVKGMERCYEQSVTPWTHVKCRCINLLKLVVAVTSIIKFRYNDEKSI